MSSIKWRKDFENLENEGTYLCVLPWHDGEYIDCLIWWEYRLRFSDDNGNDYRTEEILGFVAESDVIASFNEQFRIQQPTTGE